MYILGISAFFHDAASALIHQGQIIAAAQEERFSRQKNDASFPSQSIQFCLNQANIQLPELEAIVFYDKPFLKFERLLETYYRFAPRGFSSFRKFFKVWIRQKLMIKSLIKKELEKIQGAPLNNVQLLFSEHHLSHAASAYYPSSFEEAAILTLDGVGEWASTSIALGQGNQIKTLKEIHFPHSLGLLYSAFTYFLGFKVNAGEYKFMGLAPYGNPHSSAYKEYSQIIRQELIDIQEDGSFWLNQKYFQYATGLKMIQAKKWEKLFNLKTRQKPEKLLSSHCDLALAVQHITEEVVLKLAQESKRLTQSKNLCLAGGVALNSVANGKIHQAKLFDNIHIHPAAGDAGGALGAALSIYYIYYRQNRSIIYPDALQGSYLGPAFSQKAIEQVIEKYQADYTYFEDFENLAQKTAKLISEGKIIAWFQGRMEWGPRALGNRSILADPRQGYLKQKINHLLKFRETFRPFAPAILNEEVQQFFNIGSPSPYMLMVFPLLETYRHQLPSDFFDWAMEAKAHWINSTIPAVCHVDFTARVQTVHKETNARFWRLIKEFQNLTDCPMLLNTSFNTRDEPIVCSPEEAYRSFMRCGIDYLVIENYLFYKSLDKTNTEVEDWG